MFILNGPNYHCDREYVNKYTVYPEEPKSDNIQEKLLMFTEKFDFFHLQDLIKDI